VLFQVWLTIFVAGQPGVGVADGVFPRVGGNAAMAEVMIFLDSVGQLFDWSREDARWQMREIVVEQFAGAGWRRQQQ